MQGLEGRYEGWDGVFYFERMEKKPDCDDGVKEMEP